LKSGDVLMLDTGASARGYFCDFDRNFAIGHADEAAQATYRTLWQATEAGLAAARPGRTCAQVFSSMAKVIGDANGGIGRLGHGLGTELTEEPSLAGFDHTVLEPGMILTLEPSMSAGDGRMMVHEENIVVTEDAPRLLTERAAPELPVIT
jgi:Xaa-Pro aminopeptidase